MRGPRRGNGVLMFRRWLKDGGADTVLFIAFLVTVAINVHREYIFGALIAALAAGYFLRQVIYVTKHYTTDYLQFKKAYDRIGDREFKRGFERGLNAKTFTEKMGEPRRYDKNHR